MAFLTQMVHISGQIKTKETQGGRLIPRTPGPSAPHLCAPPPYLATAEDCSHGSPGLRGAGEEEQEGILSTSGKSTSDVFLKLQVSLKLFPGV